MGVATVPSSASQAFLGLSRRLSANQSALKKPVILGFKSDKKKTTTLAAPAKPIQLGLKTRKDNLKKPRSVSKRPKEVHATTTAEICPHAVELDLNEAAAKLENIYKRSPAIDDLELENFNSLVTKSRGGRKKNAEVDEKKEDASTGSGNVVRNRMRKVRRLSLNKRIELKMGKEDKTAPLARNKKAVNSEDEKIEELVREYSASTEVVSMDWKKTRIPPVLSSSEHAWLFKLMEPMKTLLQVRQNLERELGRDPTDATLGKAMNMTAAQVRRHMEIGHAARNKLIKHNLRLVLFVMNKYFQDFTNGPKFQDLCQAGVQGLMTATDRFEPRKSFRLSTYAFFLDKACYRKVNDCLKLYSRPFWSGIGKGGNSKGQTTIDV
uniref:RNA polymerase sigma-70 region 2 domain-containing protein n=1 Tax=Opuntia streptacantha TaxID=393608 RepID=A0A7C9AKW2_OPUST